MMPVLLSLILVVTSLFGTSAAITLPYNQAYEVLVNHPRSKVLEHFAS